MQHGMAGVARGAAWEMSECSERHLSEGKAAERGVVVDSDAAREGREAAPEGACGSEGGGGPRSGCAKPRKGVFCAHRNAPELLRACNADLLWRPCDPLAAPLTCAAALALSLGSLLSTFRP